MIGSTEIVEEIPQTASVPHGIGESPKPPTTALKPSEKAAPNAVSKKESLPKAATTAECPPDAWITTILALHVLPVKSTWDTVAKNGLQKK
ncbi:EKA-like protein [Blumeria hordei DH14]|uniref:EKA-like protein n=1 Tax=Blumeria graminis f. sp. hordei (strain DH14) TaxID=546991 RepID=N1JBB9_BLUG1|nr:EKA-like protein [Blumeria hordei DH14]